MRTFHQESIRKGCFEIAILINIKLREFRNLIENEQPEKLPGLDLLASSTISLLILGEIRNLIDQKNKLDYLALFEYLKQFGGKVLSFLGELYEKIDHPGFRAKVLELIRNTLQENPASVAIFINDQKPARLPG